MVTNLYYNKESIIKIDDTGIITIYYFEKQTSMPIVEESITKTIVAILNKMKCDERLFNLVEQIVSESMGEAIIFHNNMVSLK